MDVLQKIFKKGDFHICSELMQRKLSRSTEHHIKGEREPFRGKVFREEIQKCAS